MGFIGVIGACQNMSVNHLPAFPDRPRRDAIGRRTLGTLGHPWPSRAQAKPCGRGSPFVSSQQHLGILVTGRDRLEPNSSKGA
jgi:hypothetical protein